ncbi:hypothetical protein Tco_0915773 [Tanacetum coccineum]
MKTVRATRVAIHLGVGNFSIACIVDDTARSPRIPVRPKMMLYGDDARTTINFIMVLRCRPTLPNATSSSILPIGINCSSKKPTSFVRVAVRRAFTDDGRL